VERLEASQIQRHCRGVNYVLMSIVEPGCSIGIGQFCFESKELSKCKFCF
jgi:hypothetical protein